LLLHLRRQARKVGGRVDLLVGNHELALARGDSSISDVAQPLELGAELASAIRGGRLHAARAYRQYLITHAGVNPELMTQLVREVRTTYSKRVTVASLARYLNHRLKLAFKDGDFSHPMFAIGQARGGFAASGGIFWADFEFEHNCIARHPRVWQVFGHSPPVGNQPFRVSPDQRRLTIDVGICAHYGGYHAYVRLLPDRVVGIHCTDSLAEEDLLACVAEPPSSDANDLKVD
jgi:hypothetical protein